MPVIGVGRLPEKNWFILIMVISSLSTGVIYFLRFKAAISEVSYIYTIISVQHLVPFHTGSVEDSQWTHSLVGGKVFGPYFCSSEISCLLALFSDRGECSFSNMQSSPWISLNYVLIIQQSHVHSCILIEKKQAAKCTWRNRIVWTGVTRNLSEFFSAHSAIASPTPVL